MVGIVAAAPGARRPCDPVESLDHLKLILPAHKTAHSPHAPAVNRDHETPRKSPLANSVRGASMRPDGITLFDDPLNKTHRSEYDRAGNDAETRVEEHGDKQLEPGTDTVRDVV